VIFILGGAGFVGSAFARVCEKRGWEHAVIARANYATFVGKSCDVFVNANGNSRKNLAVRAPLEDFDASVRTVRASLADFKFASYVLLSSCDVYPDCSTPSATIEEGSIDMRRQSPYGFHKYLAELSVRHVASRWLVTRLGGFVGPGLWKNAIYDILVGGPLWLDPRSELQFIATDDAAEIILGLARASVSNDIVNVCGKGTIVLQEVIEAVGKPVPVHPDSPRVVYDVSTRKLERLTSVPETRETVLEFVRSRPNVGRPASAMR
jgi:nucleoside-diphosphate-sugar epimerase